MNALVVYGSLVNKSELTRGGFPLGRTCPVILRGFKRVFRQEPSRRHSGQGEERAVLNVVASGQDWLNGLLVWGLDDSFFVDLDEREKGYDRIEVSPSSLRKYHPSSSYATPIPRNVYVYTGEAVKQSDSILPSASYLEICLEGAREWGEGFYEDFLDSTFIKNEALLRTYVG